MIKNSGDESSRKRAREILTPDELRQLFTEGFTREGDRALFGICLFAGCRLSQALALQTSDIEGGMRDFTIARTLPRYLEVTPEQRRLAVALDEAY